jgi:transcriptional regulator with XRE-family HTH domain
VPNLLNLAEIKKRRQSLGLTLTEAAIDAGWNDKGRTTWHDIEAGRRQNITLDTLAGMARALRCSILAATIPDKSFAHIPAYTYVLQRVAHISDSTALYKIHLYAYYDGVGVKTIPSPPKANRNSSPPEPGWRRSGPRIRKDHYEHDPEANRPGNRRDAGHIPPDRRYRCRHDQDRRRRVPRL